MIFLTLSLYQSPIYSLILSLLLLIIIIRLQVINKKIMSNKLIWTFVLVFLTIFINVFYTDLVELIGENSIFISLIVFEIGVSLMIFFAINNNYTKSVLTQSILKSLDANRAFVLLDKKGRIKEISDSLLTVFGNKKEEVLGVDFLTLFFNYYTFVRVVETKMTLEEFIDDFKSLEKDKKYSVELKRTDETAYYTFNINKIFKDNKIIGTSINLEMKDSFWLSNIENSNKDLIIKYDSIIKQYKATMALSKDNYIFHNLNTHDIWVNDNLHKILKIGGNNLGSEDYLKLINKDDVEAYLKVIRNLSKESPSYNIKYRIRIFNKEILVCEEGTRIYTKKNNDVIIGIFTLTAGSGYEKSNNKLLDDLHGVIEFKHRVKNNIENNMNQYVATFELINLKDINDRYSRTVGNMVIGEYIRFIRQTFVENDGDIFRLGGLRFSFIIVDNNKMQAIRRALESKESILHGTFNYSNKKINLEVKMGISMTGDSLKANDIIDVSSRALEMALNSKQKGYVIYRDE